ncbi:MAG: hypothetical protein ACYSUP_01485 [Planctomycetota bacterium]|jgi:preprotein translocase subunit SecD
MVKNLTWRIVLIIFLVLAAALTLWPPSKTLKPGIDVGGGTSMVYAIDAEGLEPAETRDLSSRMITVLRRRVDPANIQNLIWRPQGDTRFEIQMPLASAEAREKRENYELVKQSLLEENINRTMILRSVQPQISMMSRKAQRSDLQFLRTSRRHTMSARSCGPGARRCFRSWRGLKKKCHRRGWIWRA